MTPQLTPSDQAREEREALDHEPNAHLDPVMREALNRFLGNAGIFNRLASRGTRQTDGGSLNLTGVGR